MTLFSHLRSLLRAPEFADEHESAAAALLHTSAWLTLLGAGSFQIFQLWVGIDAMRVNAVRLVMGLAVTALWLLRRRRLRPAGLLVTSTLFLIACFSLALDGGSQAPGMVTLLILLIMSAMTLELAPTVGWALLSLLAITGFAWAQSRGWLPPRTERSIPELWFIYAFHLCAATWLVTYSAGAVRGLLGTLGRRTSELADSEARYSQLIEQSPDVIVALKSDGTIAEISPAVEALFGYRPEELIGRSFLELDTVPKDSLQRNLRSFQALLAGDPPELTVTTVQHRDGAVHWVESNPRMVRREDGSARLYLVIRDITERIEAEGSRRALEQRLAEAGRLEALGRLSGGLAHDFNNLLLVILSNVELLEADPDRGADPLLEDVRVAAQSAADLTSRLLAFAGQQVREADSTDVAASLGRIEGLLRRLTPPNVALDLEVEDGLPAVGCDPAQLEQVVVNLVINAQQAMADGGRIQVEASRVQVETVDRERYPRAAPGEHVRIAVSDTGPGIDEATLPRIFEPFFSTRPGGTGLGLATVYGTVGQSGGHLRVHSHPGSGTCFEVLLPRSTRPARAAAEPSGAPPSATSRAVVLLVDDEPAVLSSVARLLERRGLRVLTANSAEAARAASAAEPAGVDVLLTDVVMPGTTGPRLAAELLAAQPRMKVLLMSGYAEDQLDHAELLRGAVHFIAKPFSGAALARRIEEILRDEHAPSRAPLGPRPGYATT
jgi:two-component system sensor histidine kinase EvgS